MGYGITGHLGIARQNSFGTTNISSLEFVPIISENIITNVDHLSSDEIVARFEGGNVRQGNVWAAGDIVFEPHPVLIGHFLKGVLGQSSGTLTNSAYTHEFIPRQVDFDAYSALTPYTLEIYRSIGSSWQLTDTIINALTLEIAGGAIVKATASVMSRISSLMTKSTPSFQTGNPWIWDAASVNIGGAAFADMESLTIAIDNAIEGFTYLNAQKAFGKYKRSGKRAFRVSGTIDFESQAEYENFRLFTSRAITLNLRGDATATSYFNTLNFDMPAVKYSSYPVGLTGPGRITTGFEGVAEYYTTSAYAMRTTLTNTKASY